MITNATMDCIMFELKQSLSPERYTKVEEWIDALGDKSKTIEERSGYFKEFFTICCKLVSPPLLKSFKKEILGTLEEVKTPKYKYVQGAKVRIS